MFLGYGWAMNLRILYAIVVTITNLLFINSIDDHNLLGFEYN